MSRHPFEVASFAFGTIFLVMALVGFAEAAGLVAEGLIAAVIGAIVMMAVIGIALTVKRLSAEGEAPTRPTDDQPWEEESEAVDPTPNRYRSSGTSRAGSVSTTPPEGDDAEPLRL